jgi:hypothetical protein
MQMVNFSVESFCKEVRQRCDAHIAFFIFLNQARITFSAFPTTAEADRSGQQIYYIGEIECERQFITAEQNKVRSSQLWTKQNGKIIWWK